MVVYIIEKEHAVIKYDYEDEPYEIFLPDGIITIVDSEEKAKVWKKKSNKKVKYSYKKMEVE